MEFTVTILGEEVIIDAVTDEVQEVEPDVGIMAPFVASFKGYCLDGGKSRELTLEEYDSISDKENDRICDGLTEALYE